MPNYKYVCTKCGNTEMIELPISIDPKKLFCCGVCYVGNMERRIGRPSAFIGIEDTKLGQWYKNQTGKDLMGGE